MFDRGRRLVYTGRGRDNPRNAARSTVNDLERALDDLPAGRPARNPLIDPIGCNVKWKEMAAHWMPAQVCDLA